MKKAFYLFSLAFWAACPTLFGQIAFFNANAKFGYGNHFSGVAIAIADMNSDGYDDIVHLRNGRILTIELQKPDGSGFTAVNVGQISNASQWSMCVADADNNGFNDVLAGGSYDGVKLVKANTNGSAYSTAILPGTNIFLQGSNFVDINNDGWLDIFACHDDGNNRIWANDGSGNFSPANDWIDMTTFPPSDNSGNYGSVWSDIDNDGDLDLYIAKCRTGVNSPTDGRRINQLFLNNGDGTFLQDTANTAGLRIGAQSWTADFGDIDNDGDLDCFITNHDAPSQLLLNDGNGIFTDLTTGSGIVVQGLAVQGIFRDFDNDGFVDIIVSGTNHHLFRNNGNGTFTDVGAAAFGVVQMESFAVGDLNHDGKLDVYGGYAQLYTTPSNIPDVVWINATQNGNHFLSLRLEGNVSNRSAIGARISIFGPWGVQIREVRSGESYGIMNSFAQHFGLGVHTRVDSLVVRWPSGLREVFFDVPADQSIQITEGRCISPFASISVEGSLVFCPGDSAVITVSGGNTWAWSNGETAASIAVRESGAYSAVVSDTSSCRTITPAVEIVVDPPAFPSITAEGDTIFCPGGSVVLRAGPAGGYTWSNGATTSSIDVSDPGQYTVTVPGLCRTFESAPIQISLLDAPPPAVSNDTLTSPGPAVLRAEGDAPRWYDAPLGGNLLFTGSIFEIPQLTATDTFYVEDPELYPGPVFFAGPPAHTGNSQFSGNNTNGQIIFDALQPFRLYSVKVYTDTPGKRIIELRNAAGVVLQTRPEEIANGESIIILDFVVPAGENLVLTTNTEQNQTSFNFTGPRLRRTIGGTVQYPYVTPDVVRIKTSNLGTDAYYYFYNWEVRLPDQECNSERIPVYAVLLEPNGAVEAVSNIRVTIAPNPAGKEAFMTIGPVFEKQTVLIITDQFGRLVSRATLAAGQPNHRLDLSGFSPGVYHVNITNGRETIHRILVVQP